MNRMNTLENTGDPAAGSNPTGTGVLSYGETHAGHAPRAGRPGRTRGERQINVGRQERYGSVLGGSALVALGLLRGKLSGLGLAGLGALIIRRGLQGHCEVYESLGINTAAGERPDPHALYDHGVKIQETATVNKPAQELYDYWHDLTNLSKFMPQIERVDVHDNGRSHWVMNTVGGTRITYDAETINDEPGRLIAWQSVDGADIQHSGSVRFIPVGDYGTQVRLNIEYLPPAGYFGKFGAKALRLFGQAPENDVRQSLRNFKQLMEAGEIATNAGGPRGTCSR